MEQVEVTPEALFGNTFYRRRLFKVWLEYNRLTDTWTSLTDTDSEQKQKILNDWGVYLERINVKPDALVDTEGYERIFKKIQKSYPKLPRHPRGLRDLRKLWGRE